MKHNRTTALRRARRAGSVIAAATAFSLLAAGCAATPVDPGSAEVLAADQTLPRLA